MNRYALFLYCIDHLSLLILYSAILTGTEKLLNFQNLSVVELSAVKKYLRQYTKLDHVWREYTRAKISVIIPLLERYEKVEQSEESNTESLRKKLLAGFAREQEALSSIHSSLSPIVELANLHYQLARKMTENQIRTDKDALQVKKDNVLISVIQETIRESEQVRKQA